MDKAKKIGIVGSGLIGKSFALLFVGSGYRTVLYDCDAKRLEDVPADFRKKLTELKEANLLRSTTISIDDQVAALSTTTSLKECMDDAFFVIECTFENVELKTKVFLEIDEFATQTQVLASSVSTFVPSSFTEGMKNRNRVVVVHPTNPPFFCPFVEVVPSPWSDADVIDTAYALMREVGQEPIRLKKEVPGFALNRMQYSLLQECYSLIKHDVVSPEDIDKVMRHGLGMRWAFIGPLETTHLNAPAGVVDYHTRYVDTFNNAVAPLSLPKPGLDDPVVIAKLKEHLETKVPVGELQGRMHWRDKCLAALHNLKKQLGD